MATEAGQETEPVAGTSRAEVNEHSVGLGEADEPNATNDGDHYGQNAEVGSF